MAQALEPGQLALCWGSVEELGLQDLARVASGVGFRGITLNVAQCQDARMQGMSDSDIRQLLADLGLGVSNVDPLFSWAPDAVELPGDDVIARSSRATVDEVCAAACAMGAGIVNAPLGLAQPESEQQIIDSFAALCERAGSFDLRVSLEFMPFARVADLAAANRIVDAAGRDNGGIMFDCWHHHRGGGTAQQLLDVPGERFLAVQLDDAIAEPMQDLVEETLNHRAAPGDGVIDLPAVLSALQTTGGQVIYDVEVFSEPLRAMTPHARAALLYEKSSAVLDSVSAAP